MAGATVKFVRLIEQYPCLYNNKLPEYSRKDETDKAWREVSQMTNIPVADCQVKWRNIRNGFVRSLTSTKQKKLYYMHEEMQFLLPFIKAVVHTDDTENTPQEEEANESSSTSEESDESASVKKRKIKKVEKPLNINDVDKAFVSWIKKKNTKTDSARKMFLLSLLPDVEQLSDEQMRKFRIKVLYLLEELQTDS